MAREQLRPAQDVRPGWQLKAGPKWGEVTATAKTHTMLAGVTTVRVWLADGSHWEYQGLALVACRTPEEAADGA